MDAFRPVAHVAVLVGDEVVLQRSVEHGRPVLRAPAVEVAVGETPGRAAERAALEQLGLRVELRRIVHADTEHGCEHAFFLAEAPPGSTVRTEGTVQVRLHSLLAYVVEPRALAVALVRGRPFLEYSPS